MLLPTRYDPQIQDASARPQLQLPRVPCSSPPLDKPAGARPGAPAEADPWARPGFGIRLNKEPPGITFRKKDKGGISLTTTISNPKLDLDCAPPGRPASSLAPLPVALLCHCSQVRAPALPDTAGAAAALAELLVLVHRG